jgi:uncharacterized protein with HEPN domain
MRPEKLYLTDIVEAAQSIARFVMGEDFDEFEQNEMMNSAMLQKLTVIGEAASRCQRNLQTVSPKFPGWISLLFGILLFMNISPFAGTLPGLPRQKKSLC